MKKFNLLFVAMLIGSFAIGQTYLTEGFETSVPPPGWSEYQVAGTNSWAQTTSRVHTGTYSAYFEDFNGDNNVWLITSSIDLSGGTAPQLSYWENVNYSTPSYQGPGLYVPPNILITSCNVIPANGIGYIENSVLQGYFKNMNIPRFNYSINVSAAKDVRIKLVTTDCVGVVTEHEEKRYHAPGSKTLNWPVESFNFDRVGLWNYTFSYYDTRWSRWQDCGSENCEEGPELIAILKEFTIDPTPPFRVYGESYNVSVVVNGSRDLDITLELCTTASCKPVGTEIYKSSEEEREMIWTDIKPWVDFGSDEELKFNLNVTWGDGDV